MALDSDIRTARQFMRIPILEVAREAGLPQGSIELYGPHEAKIRLRASAGAGFLYPLQGDRVTMPGLLSEPAAAYMDIDSGGNLIGSRP